MKLSASEGLSIFALMLVVYVGAAFLTHIVRLSRPNKRY